MKKALIVRTVTAIFLVVATGQVVAEEYTTTSYDPVLDAYRYNAPTNSWYAAKVKPKLKMQMNAKTPVSAEPVLVPDIETVPATKVDASVSGTPAVLDEAIANSPVAKSPESTRALPFWQDILPVEEGNIQ